MQTVHRYFLPVFDEVRYETRDVSEIEIDMPAGARVLDVALTSRGLAVYALVDPDDPPAPDTRTFIVARTGAELPERRGFESLSHDDLRGGAFLGTVKVPGDIGWHVFEVMKVAA